MFKWQAKLAFVLEKVEDIIAYQERYGSVVEMLNDKMAYDAVLMCLLQIGETLHKLEKSPYADKLPIKGAYDVRNFIAHDYEGVNRAIIEDVIRRHIPALQRQLFDVLDTETKEMMCMKKS